VMVMQYLSITLNATAAHCYDDCMSSVC